MHASYPQPKRRIHTTKRQPHRPVSNRSENSSRKLLKEQVIALGGNEDDYELVKDVQDNISVSGLNEDPELSKDISKFVKKLNSGPTRRHADEVKLEAGGYHKIEKKSSKSRGPKAELMPETSNVNPILVTIPQINSKFHFVVQPTADWYTLVPPLVPPTPPVPLAPDKLAALSTHASSLHASDIQTFQRSSSSNSSSSEASFLQRVLKSGTLSDRLGALTLLVQSSPLHNIKALETLKGMAERGKGKGGRGDSLKALRCVVDWWVGGGAPPRKLKYFRDHPLLHPSVTDQHLVLWHFEDWLKKYFFSILQILEILSLDSLPYVRTQVLTLVFTLLRDKPEQEQNLLRLLVNKLGDTDKSVCSRTSYYVLQLLQSHPSMKVIVVREITAVVLRPSSTQVSTSGLGKHIHFSDDPKVKSKSKSKSDVKDVKRGLGNAHARYYATITLNQIVLTPKDHEAALQLIHVYFEMFKELLGEGRTDETVADSGDKSTKEVKVRTPRVDKSGRVVDSGKGKAKAKEIKGEAGFAEVEDILSKFISAILTGVNRALPFAKIDSGDSRLNKHIDTLFLITHTSTFNISLQALVLIQHISASLSSSPSSSPTSKSIIDRYYRTLYASLHDPRLATSAKQAMYLNLLFKSIKADPDASQERVKAFVRRFVQVLVSGGNGGTEFVAGGLFLLGKLFSTIPGLRTMLDARSATAEEPLDNSAKGEDYDPRKRDPQYAHASSSPIWELTLLLHHYHPTISLYARQLLSSEPLTATADLSLNTLSHFLDRFVYKNPKKVRSDASGADGGKGKGTSAMQPAASGLDGTGVRLLKGEVQGAQELVNGQTFLRRKVEDIPVDQVFFHKFFSRKNEVERAKSVKRKGEDGDNDEDERGESMEAGEGEDEDGDEDEDSDEEEAEIWKVMKANLPIVGDDDLEQGSDELHLDLDEDDPFSDSHIDKANENEDGGDGEAILGEGSDDEDLISLDEEIPDGFIEYDGSDEEDKEEVWDGVGDAGEDSQKRKREESAEHKGSMRKKLRSLPTFASYEEYAKMIEGG